MASDTHARAKTMNIEHGDLEKPRMADLSPVSSTYRLIPSTRFFMVFLAFLATAATNSSGTLNFSIVCMIKPTDANSTTDNSSLIASASGSPHGAYQYEWDRSDQANLLAAYSWGATASALVAGWFSDRYGGKWVMLVGLVAAVVSNAVIPLASTMGLYWMFAARLLAGAAGGASVPIGTTIGTSWAFRNERALLTSLAVDGVNLGQLIAIGVAGQMCESAVGWPMIFYFWAVLSAVISVLWIVFYTDDPNKCRYIHPTERRLLNAVHRGPAANDAKAIDDNRQSPVATTFKTPWRHILCSRVTWAIYVAHFCALCGVCLLDVFVPTYSKEIMGLDVASNGIYSTLPTLCKFVAFLLFGVLADKITCGRSRSTTFSVKLFNTIAMGIPALGLLTLAFLDSSVGVCAIVVLFCTCTFFYMSFTAGFLRSIILIGPKICGTISSVSHFIGYSAMIGTPYVVGFLTKHGTVGEWQTVFYVASALSAFGCVEFLLFATGEEQKWADPLSFSSSSTEANITSYNCDSGEEKKEDVYDVIKY